MQSVYSTAQADWAECAINNDCAIAQPNDKPNSAYDIYMTYPWSNVSLF